LKIVVESLLVEVALKGCYVAIFGVIALQFIKDFDEYGKHGIGLAFAGDVGFLIDIKEDCLCGIG